MSYRLKVIERDRSGFVKPTINEVGGFVIKAPRGKKTPVYCQSEEDVLREFGTPSAEYPDLFEAVAYCTTAPAYIAAPYMSDALYGGVDIALSGVTGFGTGRDIDTFDFTAYPHLSHVFFTTSPYTDDLAGKITFVTGKRFKMSLYKVGTTGNQLISEYLYSLIREKDNFGKSLYIYDVFDENDYVIPKVNESFAGTAYALSGVVVNFSGGTRGTSPDSAAILAGWQNFRYSNKYPVRTFVDTRGDSAVTINNLIQTYQPYAQGITCVPLGYSATQAITFRQSLGIDSDDIALYTNWSKIVDPYNNSFAWVSQMGSVGAKYADMFDVYDAASPAGIDENGHGGQLSKWQVIEMENDYTDADTGSELQALDEAQINPIIKDPIYGVMVYGDKTMQVSLSDTSFIGTRRVYKIIIEAIVKQVLRLQEFKINDPIHRLKARTLTNSIINPIYVDGWLRDYRVVCSEENNTDEVLNARQFVLSVYIKVTPNSQEVLLKFTRIAQTQQIDVVISEG